VTRANQISEWIAKRGMRSTLLGILVNLGLSATKISAGAVGHSFALVADGLESGADVLSGLVVFFGLKIAIKPPDRDHPYGHGKAEPIAALCVGLSLVAAAVTIMVESIHEILTPHRLPAPYTLVVLAGVMIVKGFLFRHVGSVGESIGSLAVKSDASHHRSDAITSAFAFVGISIAVLGGAGWESADDWAALCAGVVILYNAWHQLRPAVFELADIAPDAGITARVKASAARVPGVLGLDKCFVRKMGFSFYVDLHIIVKGELSVREGHRIAHLVENSVLEELPQISEVLVHVEPEEELAAKHLARVR
jgi:cation diffusion facilitator family transporter